MQNVLCVCVCIYYYIPSRWSRGPTLREHPVTHQVLVKLQAQEYNYCNRDTVQASTRNQSDCSINILTPAHQNPPDRCPPSLSHLFARHNIAVPKGGWGGPNSCM